MVLAPSLLAAGALGVLLRTGRGGMGAPVSIIVMYSESALVYFLSVAVFWAWWSRDSTRHTLMELAATPADLLDWLRGSLWPTRVILTTFMTVSTVIALWRLGQIVHEDEELAFYFAGLENVALAWLNLPLVAAVFLRARSVFGGAIKSSLLLLPFQYFLVAISLTVFLNWEYIDSPAEYCVHQAAANAAFLFVYWRFRRRMRRDMERHVARMVEGK